MEVREALAAFKDAARALNEAWEPEETVMDYPSYLPSFDEFTSDLVAMRFAPVTSEEARHELEADDLYEATGPEDRRDMIDNAAGLLGVKVRDREAGNTFTVDHVGVKDGWPTIGGDNELGTPVWGRASDCDPVETFNVIGTYPEGGRYSANYTATSAREAEQLALEATEGELAVAAVMRGAEVVA